MMREASNILTRIANPKQLSGVVRGENVRGAIKNGEVMMITSTKREREKLHRLTSELESLKGELAKAWTRPDNHQSIGVIENKIRHVWNEIDTVGMAMSEPPAR